MNSRMRYGVNADLIIGAEVHFGQIRQGKGREALGWFFNINHGILELFIKHDRKSPNGFFLS